MTSLDNLEKQLAFLKKSMEKLDQPKVEEVQEPETQEKTRTTNVSIYGADEEEVKNAVQDSDNAATIKNKILGIIGTDLLVFGELYSVQNYINTIHSQHAVDLAAAKATPAAPAGVDPSAYNDAIQAKEDAIQAHKDDLKAIYTALAALTAPSSGPSTDVPPLQPLEGAGGPSTGVPPTSGPSTGVPVSSPIIIGTDGSTLNTGPTGLEEGQ